jgi:phosphoglycolate phosphatase
MTARSVIFDLDGTLIDSMPDVRRSLNATLAESGLRALSMEEVRTTIGHGAKAMLREAVVLAGGSADEDRVAAMVRRYLEFYAAEPVALTTLYPGTLDMLKRLRDDGAILGICSNKPSLMVGKVLAGLGLEAYFAGITGGDDVARSKPHADHIFETLCRMGAAAPGAVMVGDSITDLTAARNAGIPVVVVSFGYGAGDGAVEAADAVIDHFDQLASVLDRLRCMELPS